MPRPTLEEIYNQHAGQSQAAFATTTPSAQPAVQAPTTPTATTTGKRPSLESLYTQYGGDKAPSAPMASQYGPSAPAPQTSFMQDLGTSAKETLLDPFTSRFGNIDYNDQGAVSNILQSVGALAGGAVDVAGKGLLGAAKLLTPKPVEDAVGDAFNKGTTALASAVPDEVKTSIAQWAEAHPEAAANLGAIVDISSIVPVGKAFGSAKTSLGIGLGEEVALTATKRITQAKTPTPALTKMGQVAYNSIPAEGIRTYSQLEKVLQASNATDLSKVTNHLLQDTTKYRLANFEINKEGFKFNPVADAITGLKELGVKVADTDLLSKVRQFELKLNKGEMLQNDVNELAKLLGSKKSAFKQSGELLKNVNAVKAENTRLALKEIARQGMSPEVTALDKAVSNRIAFAEAAKKMSQAVERELQKAQNLNVFQKTVKFSAQTIDILMGRLLTTVINSLKKGGGGLSPSQIEKELAKNLKIIQQINASKDVNKMREFLKSIGYFTASQVINTQSDEPAQTR